MSRKDKEKQIPEEELLPEVPEEASGDETETAEEASVQDEDALKKELEAANAKTAEYLAMAQRVQADFDNQAAQEMLYSVPHSTPGSG